MEPKIEVVEKALGSAIEMENNIKMFEISRAMNSCFQTLAAYIGEDHLSEKNLFYARFVEIDWEEEINKGFFTKLWDTVTHKWHFYNGVTTPELLKSEEDILTITHTLHTYLQATHTGSYYSVAETYKAMCEYAANEKLTLSNGSIEIYLNDPHEVPEEELQTTILIQIH
ncbi:MAG TPA: hypothetical protein ENK72_02445 [Epsilonproteobacteria bacterium]|nr:hypothetical protein [Campylobacterota bacterium]